MLESCSASSSLLERVQALRGCSVADTNSIWNAFEENSFFAISVADTFFVPYLSALYTPGYFFAAEDAISTRSPFSAVGRSLPRLQLSLREAEISWFAALWLPCTGDADALLNDALLVFYGFSPLAVLCALPYRRAPPDALAHAAALVKRAGVRVPDLDLFILSST
jgi:hypothetical protein